MSTPLLQTKLHIPPTRPELVSRPRLTRRLDEGFRPERRLTLVSAPAGFGKTTLLGEWAGKANHPVAWLTLDPGDNDPTRFWTYVAAALQAADGDAGRVGQPTVQPSRPAPNESSLNPLLNRLAALPDPLALVLDDYHVITTSSIHEGLTFLLGHLPRQIHLVLATRADPPLPLARMRGRGQLTELYQSDLSFTPAEAARFLNHVTGLELSSDLVAALERRTEGWVAGLQLAAVSMRGHEDVAAFVRAFTGSNRYILDYLGAEVLRQQPHEVRQFLLQTAILDRLSAPLCDAVVDQAALEKSQGGSQSLLEYLDRNNLFVVSLDDERRWYRYHRLFADLLRQRLQRHQPQLIPELHRRASQWYAENQLVPAAVDHALAAGDFRRAAGLIDRVAWPMLARCENVVLLNWLDALPAETTSLQPRLEVARAWALALAGEWDAVASCMERIDPRDVPGERAAVQAYAAAVRGDTRQAIEFARRALDHLPQQSQFLRGFLLLNLGIAHSSHGNTKDASRALRQAVQVGRATDEPDLTLAALGTLGHVQDTRGLLHRAMETHQEVFDLVRHANTRPGPIVGIASLGIAEVLYEWNDLDGALRNTQDGIKFLELGRFLTYLLFGHSLRARISLARRDLDGARQAIEQAEGLAQGHDAAFMSAVLAELRARLLMFQGHMDQALEWARAHRRPPDDRTDRVREVEQMAVARVLVAHARSSGADDGAELDHVLRMVPHLLEGARSAGRTDSAIKLLVLQATALEARGRFESAVETLQEALSLGEPEGYVRTFVDEGEPMARLLRHALTAGVAPDYAARLLAAFGQEAEIPPPGMENLVEPLTERELEVLRLIVGGLSNAEIAKELFIAVSTVKTHVNHIYGKLAVESRIQAANRARTLGLV